MLELKRILWNRKTLLLFGILLLLHGVFFAFQCNEAKSNTLTGAELTEYVGGYEAYVQSVHQNVEDMTGNPLFSDTESFVYRNIVKTGEDYRELMGIRPVEGENRGIVTLLNFNLTTFLLLLAGVYIVLCFMAERQKGLYLLVRSTARGRVILSLQRIGILGIGVLAAALLLFGSTLIMSLAAFPGCDLTRPVQSVPEFGGVIGTYAIWEYLCLFFIKKVLGCVLCCLLLYFCMSVFRSGFCMGAFFLLFVGEYLLYTLVIPTGHWAVFRYLNLYTYVFCGTEYAQYYNLNFFGRPLHIARGADGLVLISTVFLIMLCSVRYARQYPKGEYRTLRLVERLREWVSRHKPSHSLMGWELRKVLFSQKGVFIFIVLVYLAYSASVESNYLDFRSWYVTHWYEEYAGTIDEAKVATIREKKADLEYWVTLWEDAIQRLNQNMVKYQMEGKNTDYIAQSISEYEKLIKEYEREIKGISVVLTQAEEGYAYYLDTGIMLELMEPTAYELLLVNDKQTILRNYLYTLLTVVLMLSGIMACEKASHMDLLLNSFYKGRKLIVLRKVILIVGICIVTTLSIHLVQFFQIGEVFAYTNLDSPAQCIPCVRGFPIAFTIKQYLIGLYTVRTLIAVAMGSAVMVLSNRFSRITAIAMGVFLLIIPMGLVALRFS